MPHYQLEEDKTKFEIFTETTNETIDWLKKKSEDYVTLMTYYKCAMMEIETKFNVLNEEYSLAY